MYTENQIKILSTLLNQPTKEYYLSELSLIVGRKPGVLQKGINALERDGLISSHRDGNRRLFRINQDYPLLKEIKSIVQKTAGVEGSLKQLVESISGIDIALIFGSYAKDMMRVNSDIDVLLVGDANAEGDFLNGTDKIEKIIQREINYRFYSKEEFEEKRSCHDPFLIEILSDSYILIKGEI